MLRCHDSVLGLIGDTPLVRLNRLTADLPAQVLAKLDYLNPGGSAKDRIALRMVTAAEQTGRLRPGGTIVEPTSGNTGVGLALVAQQRGYRCVFTCPDKVSAEKIALLRAYGAEVVMCPAAVPPDHPESYRSVSARLAEQIPGAFRPNQYENADNPASHYHTTGPEIWAQTEGRITHFVAGVGTGGTISGTGRYLKEVSGGRVAVIGADPDGSVYSGGTGRPYLLEGVGQPSLPGSFDPAVPDRIIGVSDRDSVALTLRMAREEGLLAGGSGGMAVAAALAVAAEAGPGDVVVVLLPDSGRGYLSKIYDENWLRRFGFADHPDSDGRTVGDLVRLCPQDEGVAAVPPDHTVDEALALLHAGGLEYLPVSAAPRPVRLAEVVGTVHEPALAALAATGRGRDAVGTHCGPALPIVGKGQLVSEITSVLNGIGAALVLDGGLPAAVITGADLLAGDTGSAVVPREGDDMR